MDPCESLVNVRTPSQKRNVFKCTKEIAKFVEVNIFGLYRPQITSLLTFIVEWKAKFRLAFSENKIVIFPQSEFTDHLKTIPWTPG
jgi:hypothetical protein